MRSAQRCVLIYNPVSGHGHLDSWNAMFVALLLEKGWRVLALTPDVQALTSRLMHKGIADSPQLQVLDWDAHIFMLGIKNLLRRAWRRWDAFGDGFFYRRPGSQATREMPFLMYWKTRLFQLAVPVVFRASYFLYARYRRLNKSATGADDIDPESGLAVALEIAQRINAALKKAKWKPSLVLNMYMDTYRTDTETWNAFDAVNRLPWAGIRFVPSNTPHEAWYLLPSLRGMCFLDENVCHVYREAFPEKHFEYFPDITETAMPEIPGGLAQEIRQRARFRKIVFLGGSIGGQKNLSRWYELIGLADPEQWFFVQVGEIHRGTLTAEDTEALDRMLSAPPENFLIRTEYLQDERSFNEIISASDVIFAVYREFRISSNMLGKAAAFEKPILVADGYLMGSRVARYGLGGVTPQDDAMSMLIALQSLPEPASLRKSFSRYREDFGVSALNFRLNAFLERCIEKL